MKESKQDTPTQPTEHAKRAYCEATGYPLSVLEGWRKEAKRNPTGLSAQIEATLGCIQRHAIDPAVAEAVKPYRALAQRVVDFVENFLPELTDDSGVEGTVYREARALLEGGTDAS